MRPRARIRAIGLFGVLVIVALAVGNLGNVAPVAQPSPVPSSSSSSAAGPNEGEIQRLTAYLRAEYPEIYNADGQDGTADDLTVTRLDLILAGGASIDAAADPALLAQLTTVILNLAATELHGSEGIPLLGDAICGPGQVDVSTVDGATELFGKARPTISEVVATLIGRWQGRLSDDGRDWVFGYELAQKDIAVMVLDGMTEGRLITSSGC